MTGDYEKICPIYKRLIIWITINNRLRGLIELCYTLLLDGVGDCWPLFFFRDMSGITMWCNGMLLN